MSAIKSAVLSALSLAPARIRNSFFHLAYNIARPEFEKFSHLYAHAPNMKMGLEAAARRGFQPSTIIDVGAFRGDWSALAAVIWPHAKIIMFEPNADKQPLVKATAERLKANLIPQLLGPEDGKEVEFFVMGSGSSILSEISPHARTVEKHTLRALDSALQEIAAPALLKIDAQGYELEILKGATRLMPQIAAILLEVAVIEINEGAPLISEVLSFMAQRGFVSYDILEIHRRPLDQALNQVDILFIRNDSPLIADKRHFA